MTEFSSAIYGPGAVGMALFQSLSLRPCQLIGRCGVVAPSDVQRSPDLVIVATKVNDISALAAAHNGWPTVPFRLVAANGLPEEEHPGLFHGAFILGSGISIDRDGELEIVPAGASFFVPVERPFHPELRAILEELAAGLSELGIPTEVVEDVAVGRELRWKKLLRNSISNALAVLLQAPMATIARITSPALLAGLVAEFNQVAAAAGIGYRATAEEAIAFLASGRGHRCSSTPDVFRGKPTEIPHLNGELVRRGAAHRLPPLPLHGLLTRFVTKGIPLSSTALDTLTATILEPALALPA
jgi:ketopantoate reductase